MAFDAGTVKGTVELDAAQFLASLDRIEQELGEVARSTGTAEKSLGGFSGTLVTLDSALNLAGRAFRVVQSAVGSLVGELASASAEAAEAQQVVQRLVVTLGVTGASNIEGTTAALREFAAAIQNTTAYSDDLVLSVTQTLAQLGVQTVDLEDATKAVLDFAAAMGINAEDAAVQFGRTLSGQAGRLAMLLPALKDLTEEQLQNGEAFRIAAERVGGFSEQLSGTTIGITQRLTNQFGELHEAIGAQLNPVLDQLRLQLLEVVMKAREIVESNGPALRNFFVDGAQAALQFGASLAEGFAFATDAVGEFLRYVNLTLPAIVGTIAEMNLQLREAILAFAEAVDFGEPDEALLNARKNAAEARAEVDRLASAFAVSAAEADKAASVTKRIADAARGADDKARELAGGLEKARTAAAGTEPILTSAASAVRVTSVWADTAAKAIAAATAQAAKFREEMEGAAEATEEVAEAAGAGAAGAAAGGGGGGEGGRLSGGAAGLRLGSVFESLESLTIAQRGVQAAAFSPWRFVREGAKYVADRVAAIANAQLDRAFADFSAEILRELGSAGIYDEGQRARILDQRISEAQRLGILPNVRQVNAFTGYGIR